MFDITLLRVHLANRIKSAARVLTLFIFLLETGLAAAASGTDLANAFRSLPLADATLLMAQADVLDQCDTTTECKRRFGGRASDCANSRSNNSVCMCGSSPCSVSTLPPPRPTPAPTPPPISPPGDQCNTTTECKNTFGNRATDCADSRSSNSVCMCGASPCSGAVIPTPRPSVQPSLPATATPSPSPTASPSPIVGNCEIRGRLQQWHRVELLCDGPMADESDNATFLNYRFNVTFTKNNEQWLVPGHFAADGLAESTGATRGSKWRAYFSPPSTGAWAYQVSFRQGSKLAINTAPNAGTALAPLDSVSGRFSVAASSASGRDMKAKGLLRHVGNERYLRHQGSGAVFIEGGVDSPENIFGYEEFDNTRKYNNVGSCKGILHRFASHERDWNNGPTWGGASRRGKSLIGLLNYLAGKGVNAVYVMAMTTNGDGCDAHPWSDYFGDRSNFDVSKLDQWEIAFSHMNSLGLLIHFMTQETENDQLLDGGQLGDQRKLYYREMISRFAHHPALQWNLGEENTNTTAQRKAFADYIRSLDAYRHPIFMHTFPGQQNEYDGLLGHASFDGPTLQFGGIPESATGGLYGDTVRWLERSIRSGKQWIVTATEASGGDAPTPNKNPTERQRVYWTWANIMAGGGGIEWYLKSDSSSGHAYDLAVEDLREFDGLWEETGRAVTFFNTIVPLEFGLNLQSFTRNNGLTSSNSDWVLASDGLAYIVFLRDGGTSTIRLSTNDAYQVHWFNPRSGDFSEGELISGSGVKSIGNPPAENNSDWAVLITNTSRVNARAQFGRR